MLQLFNPHTDKSHFNGSQLRACVTVSLAWIALLAAWDLASRMDDNVAYTVGALDVYTAGMIESSGDRP